MRRAGEARVYFERVFKSNPEQVNANLQLARLALAAKGGPAALEYLAHTREPGPDIALLRAGRSGQQRRCVAIGSASVRKSFLLLPHFVGSGAGDRLKIPSAPVLPAQILIRFPRVGDPKRLWIPFDPVADP